MLHILCLVLKIIGIILLVLLGILLLTVSLILFLPIQYRVKISTDDGMEHLSVDMSASWFLRLFWAFYRYADKKSVWKARFGWKDLTKKKSKKEIIEHEEKKETFSDTQEKHEQHEQKRKSPLFEKIKCTFTKIYDKIKKIWETKESIMEFLTDAAHVDGFIRIKNEVFLLAKRLHPKKLKGYVTFGLEDPYNTGQVLALLSVLYPFYGENIEICPDFEKKILVGNIYARGRIHGITLLITICNLILDKNVQKLYKDYKSLKQ